MRKRFFRRGPDGFFAEFWTTHPHDDWQPAIGQNMAVSDTLHGVQWLTVVGVRVVYRGSMAHDEIAAMLANEPNAIHLDVCEVYLEDTPEQDQGYQLRAAAKPPPR